MNKIVNLTKDGFDNLQSELKQLKETKRPQAVERLQKARAMGDLSENSEYVAAKEELAFIEGRVQEIEEVLKNVQVIERPPNNAQVALGTSVVVLNGDQKDEFHIVGEYEADPVNKKISPTSPIGKTLIGKKVGDIVEVKAPAGNINYKIVEIR